MNKNRVIKWFKNIPIIKTERLVLRRMKPSDYKDMYEYSCRPEVTRYLLWCEHESLEQTYGYLESINQCYKRGEYYDWAVTLADSGKMIGTCGFTSFDFENDRVEVGYVLNPTYWGKGIATEAVSAAIEFAFIELGANRVEAKFIEGNNASLRVTQKCGMTFEGYHKKYMKIKGEYKNIGFSAITKDEFVPKDSYEIKRQGFRWNPFS